MNDPHQRAAAPAHAPAPGGIAARARAAGGAPYLAGLNPEQREAVETLDGPVLVLAGAGTGKTRVLTTRIAHILSLGRAKPSEILAVTFTNKAAREMKARVGQMVGQIVEGMPWLGTFHSIGARILRRHAELAELKPDFTILDTDDQIRLIKQLIEADNIDEKRWPARIFAAMLDGWKNRGLTPEQVPAGEGRELCQRARAHLYKAYQARLKALNAADFGDLLIENIRIFRAHPGVLRDYQARFKFILVDEYQDTNVAQYLWLRLLAQRTGHAARDELDGSHPLRGDAALREARRVRGKVAHLWQPHEVPRAQLPTLALRSAAARRASRRVAGRRPHRPRRTSAASATMTNRSTAGAAPRSTTSCASSTTFQARAVIRLERNYRSTGHILAAASHLIAHNEGRLGKTLRTEDEDGEKVSVTSAWDSEEEARAIGEEIEQLQRQNHTLNEIAILVRASFQMREFEDRFVTLGLPYRVIGGPRFYERAEIRDALAYLRLVNQPADDLAFERIVNVPKRGLGDATIKLLHDHARVAGIPLLEAARAVTATEELKPKPRAALRDLVAALDRWRAQRDATPHNELAEIVLDESGYTEMWQKEHSADAAGRLENLKELVRSMEEFENLQGFLEHVALVMDADGGADADAVSIMTLHSAKGLEFDTVFLPGWEEGLLPHQRSLDEQGRAGLEEERRLAHVGLTRARRRAKIYFVANRRIHGSWSSSLPSRFIDELPEASVEVTESQGGFGGFSAYGNYGSRFDTMETFGSSYRTPGWQRAQRRGRGKFEEDSQDTDYGEQSSPFGVPRYEDTDEDEAAAARARRLAEAVRVRDQAARRGAQAARSERTGGGAARRAAPLTIEGELVAKSTGTVSPYTVGDRVFHLKFGNGNVTHVEGNKLIIQFDKAGEKRVLDSFVERV